MERINDHKRIETLRAERVYPFNVSGNKYLIRVAWTFNVFR